MRTAGLIFLVWSSSAAALAAAPAYLDDPFGDDHLAEAPLILDVAHPTSGRGEMAVLFSSSVIDKYTAHLGAHLELDYYFTDTFGAALSFGMQHGQLTRIVTDPVGIIGNKMQACIENVDQCADINPQVPDFKQITGVAQALAIWAPLYGKINLVSEIDVNLQAYLLLGAGVNGTRRVKATANQNPDNRSDYALTGKGFLEGGLFDHAEVHVAPGVGLKVFLLDVLALRVEARGLLFLDEFDFGTGKETYVSQYWFVEGGVGVTLF